MGETFQNRWEKIRKNYIQRKQKKKQGGKIKKHSRVKEKLLEIT